MAHNAKKRKQLGMPTGTAVGRLRKRILFSLIQETEKDKCFRCGKMITNVDELSVEHKEPWLDSNDPVGLFFDLDNIAFSHLSCNSGAHRSGREPAAHGTITSYMEYGCRCTKCTKAKAQYRKKRYQEGAGRLA